MSEKLRYNVYSNNRLMSSWRTRELAEASINFAKYLEKASGKKAEKAKYFIKVKK